MLSTTLPDGTRVFNLTPYRAMAVIESQLPADPEEVKQAWTYLVQSGYIWRLDKEWQKAALKLVNEKKILPPNYGPN